MSSASEVPGHSQRKDPGQDFAANQATERGSLKIVPLQAKRLYTFRRGPL